jgi:hypothetical protein
VSTIVEILKATEEVRLPDGRRVLAADLERSADAADRSGGMANNGTPITHNFSGQPSVHVVGRGRVVKPPIRSQPAFADCYSVSGSCLPILHPRPQGIGEMQPLSLSA